MKKKLLIAVVALVVLGVVGFVAFKIMGQRRVDTKVLVAAFVSAPGEVKAQIDQAVVAIKAEDYLASVKALKGVADKGGLSPEQKTVLGRTTSDISGMKLGDKADAVTEVILDIQTKLSE